MTLISGISAATRRSVHAMHDNGASASYIAFASALGVDVVEQIISEPVLAVERVLLKPSPNLPTTAVAHAPRETIQGLSGSALGVPGTLCAATDGSLRGAVASWSYLASNGSWSSFSTVVPKAQTSNNTAEVAAIAAAVEVPGIEVILTDSRTAQWAMQKWSAGLVAHIAAPKRLEPLLERLQEQTVAGQHDGVRVEWVRGHDGHALNEAADALCRFAYQAQVGTWSLDRAWDESQDLAEKALKSWAAST